LLDTSFISYKITKNLKKMHLEKFSVTAGFKLRTFKNQNLGRNISNSNCTCTVLEFKYSTVEKVQVQYNVLYFYLFQVQFKYITGPCLKHTNLH
jgi:hypothetical protein